MRKSALFLDRDGIINIDHGYVHKQSEVEFIDGIFSLCKVAKAKGYKIFIITNQAGIGRGYFSEVDFFILMDWMREKFNQLGAKIDDIYFCPFHPTGGIGRYKVDSECRKPRPGMILQASKEYDIDLSNSGLNYEASIAPDWYGADKNQTKEIVVNFTVTQVNTSSRRTI